MKPTTFLFALRVLVLTLIFLPILCVLCPPAHAQRFGGSFGGSAWGNRTPTPTYSAPSRPTVSTPTRSTPVYRAAPAPTRTVYTAPRTRPTVYAPAAPANRVTLPAPTRVTGVVDHHVRHADDDNDHVRSIFDNAQDDGTPTQEIDLSGLADMTPVQSWVCAGTGVVLLIVLAFGIRANRRRSYFRRW